MPTAAPITHASARTGKMEPMCGRYATARARQELLDEFQIQLDATEDALEPDYNVAPTRNVPVVLARHAKDAPEEPALRQLRLVRWGLVPSWAKDISIGSKMINARAETVREKPSYRRAFAKRRCLLPADGFYEWYKVENPGEKPQKQPFFIHPKDGQVMAMAGLYELWRPRTEEGEEPADWLWTCTIITTKATDEVGRIHDRMPMVVQPDKWGDWLDPDRTDPDAVQDLLAPAVAVSLEAYPVSKAVNNVKNNGPELMTPSTNGDIPGDHSGTLL